MCFIPFGLDSRITLNSLHTFSFSSTIGGDMKDELQKCHSNEVTACEFATENIICHVSVKMHKHTISILLLWYIDSI